MRGGLEEYRGRISAAFPQNQLPGASHPGGGGRAGGIMRKSQCWVKARRRRTPLFPARAFSGGCFHGQSITREGLGFAGATSLRGPHFPTWCRPPPQLCARGLLCPSPPIRRSPTSSSALRSGTQELDQPQKHRGPPAPSAALKLENRLLSLRLQAHRAKAPAQRPRARQSTGRNPG